MYSVTNYSILYTTEIKARFWYLCNCSLVVGVLAIANINMLLIHVLYPLELFNIDVAKDTVSFLLLSTYNGNLFDLYKQIVFSPGTNVYFEYYPIQEVNIVNNNAFYNKLILYVFSIYVFPIFLYQLYIFILPSLSLSEMQLSRRAILIFLLLYIIYLQRLHHKIMYLVANVTLNQYQEYYNYEFDIEFDLLNYVDSYVSIHFAMVLIFLCLAIGFNVISKKGQLNVYKYICLVCVLLCCTQIVSMLCALAFYVVSYYILYIKITIANSV